MKNFESKPSKLEVVPEKSTSELQEDMNALADELTQLQARLSAAGNNEDEAKIIKEIKVTQMRLKGLLEEDMKRRGKKENSSGFDWSDQYKGGNHKGSQAH